MLQVNYQLFVQKALFCQKNPFNPNILFATHLLKMFCFEKEKKKSITVQQIILPLSITCLESRLNETQQQTK